MPRFLRLQMYSSPTNFRRVISRDESACGLEKEQWKCLTPQERFGGNEGIVMVNLAGESFLHHPRMRAPEGHSYGRWDVVSIACHYIAEIP